MCKSEPQSSAAPRTQPVQCQVQSPHAPTPSCSRASCRFWAAATPCKAHLDQKQRAEKGGRDTVCGCCSCADRGTGLAHSGLHKHKSARHLSTTSVTVQRWVGALWGVWVQVLGGFRKSRATEWFFLAGAHQPAIKRPIDAQAPNFLRPARAGEISTPLQSVQSSTAQSGSTRCWAGNSPSSRIQPASLR